MTFRKQVLTAGKGHPNSDGDHRVVHFQQKTHPVPFVCQLLLGRSALSSCNTLSTATATCCATCCMKPISVS